MINYIAVGIKNYHSDGQEKKNTFCTVCRCVQVQDENLWLSLTLKVKNIWCRQPFFSLFIMFVIILSEFTCFYVQLL